MFTAGRSSFRCARLGALAMCFTGCLSAVPDCEWQRCSGGDGGDLVSADAGLLDGGAIDCFAQLAAMSQRSDAISVHGQAGALGQVDYTSFGSGDGSAAAPNGLKRITAGTIAQRGTPTTIKGTELWMFIPQGQLVAGQAYSGDNVDQHQSAVFVDFQITAASGVVSCPGGKGTGLFSFTHYQDRSSTYPIEGSYRFLCASSGVNVTGCFHYQ